ncbi:MAG: hypothetical protein PWP31_308 [Clostridia bacterium]|nr:hypothetical protein [Clostridia bacterium]
MRKLKEILQDELKVLKELVAVSQKEQITLKTEDIKSLQSVTEVKADLSRRLAMLEQERGQSPELNKMDKEIDQLKEALANTVRELQEINETNRLLTRQSLAYVKKILSLLKPDEQSSLKVDRIV